MPSAKISLEDIKKSACGKLNPHIFEKKVRKQRRPTKEVLWVENELRQWCEKKGYALRTEFKFNEYRKFKFDFYIEELRLGIEYMGLNSQKSGHTTITGYTKDSDKLNLAISNGFRVYYFTVLNYKNIIDQVEKII